MRKLFSMVAVAALALTVSPVAFGSVTIVKESALAPACQSIGTFNAKAGYGKKMNGKRLALSKAKKKAEAAGANYAVVLQLNGGASGLNGYCLLEGYVCPEAAQEIYE